MKKKLISIIILVMVVLYSFSVYSINKNSPNLRNYKEERINQVFDAFEGKLLVKSIKLINYEELMKTHNMDDHNKKYVDSKNDDYLKIIYVVKDIKNQDCLDIKANVDGYIFYDGLPHSSKISENEYEYLIPIPKEKLYKQKVKKIKIFFDNLKVNELEHHFINFSL